MYDYFLIYYFFLEMLRRKVIRVVKIRKILRVFDGNDLEIFNKVEREKLEIYF